MLLKYVCLLFAMKIKTLVEQVIIIVFILLTLVEISIYRQYLMKLEFSSLLRIFIKHHQQISYIPRTTYPPEKQNNVDPRVKSQYSCIFFVKNSVVFSCYIFVDLKHKYVIIISVNFQNTHIQTNNYLTDHYTLLTHNIPTINNKSTLI